MILKNRELYEEENTRFIKIDITQDRLPKADLWLCRDCLFHFSNEDILKTIKNFLESDINYLLTSSHIECRKNRNIRTGSFRLLNLELPPFSFNKPLFTIDDWIEGHPPRQLLLWEKKMLSDASIFSKALIRTM